MKAIFNSKFVNDNGVDYTKHNGETVTILDIKEYRWDTRYTIRFKNGTIVKNIMECELEFSEE